MRLVNCGQQSVGSVRKKASGPSLVTLDAEVRKLTEAQMSLAEFYATVPLFLKPMTYEGDEIIGASPLPHG